MESFFLPSSGRPSSPRSSGRSRLSYLGHSERSHGAPRLGSWVGAGLVASTLLLCPAARADSLTAWQFNPTTQQLTFTLPTGITPQYAVGQNPNRLVVTLPQTQMGAVTAAESYNGAVSQVSLSQVNGDTVVVLDLAPSAVLTGEGASLVAIAAGDQTRWMITALVVPGGAPALATLPGVPATGMPATGLPAAGMTVELPVIPGNNPSLGFPAAGQGRLSTSAANLMLPSDINNLTNLPDTLPVDPFNLGVSGEQVSVPSLAELDAVVGPVATAPQGAAGEPDLALGAVPLGSPAAGAVIALEPPPLPSRAISSGPAVGAEEPAAVDNPGMAPTATPLASIDSETSGQPIAVVPPPEVAVTSETMVTPEVAVTSEIMVTPEVAVTPETEAPAIAPTPDTPDWAEPVPALPTVPEPTIPAVDPAAIALEPPILAPSTDPALTSAIVQEPPAIATLPVAADPNLLAVPNAPTTRTQGTVTPPAEPVVLAAVGDPILFGSPLPSSTRQAAYPGAVDPIPAERPLSPDTLVAAGTVLELRYVGNEPLDLNINSTQNQVLLLAHDIRDPITNGIVAPAGSQLIGQFEPSPSGQGQRWVSKQLISPTGQQVTFATTTDYLVGSAEISTPRLAAGVGLGALALMVLTSFSGVGLLGGALIGATTVVGTSPQHIMIEPNQIIQVQVLQDVPRAIPIASASEYSQEWGVGGW